MDSMPVIKMTADTDLYHVLGIERHAAADDIRRRYRHLMQTEAQHPDLGGDTETAALINRAYAVLGNPQLRQQYDARLDVLNRISRGFPTVDIAATAPARAVDPARECVFCGTPHGATTVDDPESRCATCSSPLHRATANRLERWDQRAIARIPRNLPVRFFTDWRQADGFTGRTEDLSLSGLRLVCRTAIRPGQHVRLVSNVLEAVGYVVRSVPRRVLWRTEHVVGIAFVTMRMAQTAGGFVSDQV